MIKLIDILNEAKIVPQGAVGFTNTNHPAVYNFVVANKEKILQAIKDNYDRNINVGFEEDTNIRDIPNTIVDKYNYWSTLDDNNEFPNGQEIIIQQSNLALDNCQGISITNMNSEIHSKFVSGVSLLKLPKPYDNMGLYYGLLEC